jgi:flagellar biosynthesis/type III secretory pathway protein FliH
MKVSIFLPKATRSDNKVLIIILFISLTLFCHRNTFGQSALDQLINSKGAVVGNIPAVNGPVPVYGNSSSVSSVKGSSSSVSASPGAMLTTGIMQMLLTKMLSPDPKQAQAEAAAKQAELDRIAAEAEIQRQIEAALEKERYDNMMKLYKPAPGSQSLEMKTLDSGAPLDFKNLNGEAEQMSEDARRQFESSGNNNSIPEIKDGNDFFGIPVSSPDFQTLINPENDPNIVDLENADNYIKENIAKEESAKAESVKKDEAAQEKKELPEGYCANLQAKLSGFTETRAKFQKTINLTQTELSKWKAQNNDALWNAAKSGVSLVTDIFLKHLDLRKNSAMDIKKYLEALPMGKTPGAVDNYVKILDQVINYKYNLPKTVDNIKKASDYAILLRDATQVLAEDVAKSDNEVSSMLNDPNFKVLLNDGNPDVDAGQSAAGKIADIVLDGKTLQEKLVGAFTKTMPIVAWCQFAVDQTYNATDWILSYKNICNLNNVTGKETEAAQYLQNKIFETQSMLKECPQ